jgi:tripartite-type tricarboxylate transporter receptor subunit TctC
MNVSGHVDKYHSMKKLALILIMFLHLSANAIEFTVMHSAGGVSDITTRFLVDQIHDKDYQVINRPGAAGKIALRHLLQENTMMLATMAQVFVTNPINFRDLDHAPDKELQVISTIAIMPSVLVCNKKSNINTLKDFESTTRSLSFGVGGYGSSEHIATEILIRKSKVKHLVVPYGLGGSSSIINLLGGHIDCMFGNYPTLKPHLNNLNLSVLLSSHDMGLKPTWKDAYNESFPFDSYLSVIVPTNMPAATKAKISNDLQLAFNDKDYDKSLQNLGLFPKSSTSVKAVDQAMTSNRLLKKFIIENNIRISQ